MHFGIRKLTQRHEHNTRHSSRQIEFKRLNGFDFQPDSVKLTAAVRLTNYDGQRQQAGSLCATN
jgi:hypothetical protein